MLHNNRDGVVSWHISCFEAKVLRELLAKLPDLALDHQLVLWEQGVETRWSVRATGLSKLACT